MVPLTRRDLLLATTAWLAQPRAGRVVSRPAITPPGPAVEIRLDARVAGGGQERVSFGLPLPPGFLHDAGRVRVLDSAGREVDAVVRPLEPWRLDGRDGAIRSLLVQCPADFRATSSTRIRVTFDAAGPRSSARHADPVAIEETLIDPSGLQGPRVLASLPAEWLCASWIAGPQVPASRAGAYADYDRFVERSFPESLAYLDSDIYHHWLFDRPAVYDTQYIRTGDPRFLEAAYHATHFMRTHTMMHGPDAGFFTLKGADVKYVYPRAMHLHYLLTGDTRALDAGTIMARFCLTHWDPVYRPERYSVPPLGTDPEKDRLFWSPRHQAYGLLGVLHGWELTGDRVYWDKAREYIDALEAHQRQPPDGHPPDGSFRQNWALYDPNETLLEGATSPWMMAILVDALFQDWLLTGDERIPPMVVRWCDFLDRRGFVPNASRAYYIVDCLGDRSVDEAPGPQEQGVERHSTELAMTFAMGLFFSRDPSEQVRFRRRFDRLFAKAVTIDANRPVRAYNWAFQASSRLVYFMQQSDK